MSKKKELAQSRASNDELTMKKCKKHHLVNCQHCKFGGNDEILYLIVISVTTFLILQFLSIPGVNAETNITHIAIEFSDSCKVLISINDTETCYSFFFLDSMYPDTKLKKDYKHILEQIKIDPKTEYQTRNAILDHKLQCVSRDFCDIFEKRDNQEVMYWYNPDDKVRKYYDAIITIYPNMLIKNIKRDSEESIFIDNGTMRQITYNTNRLYIDDGCKHVTYDPLVISEELGRIIYYVYNNCRDDSILGKLKDNYIQTIDKHVLDITTSPHYQYEQELKAKMEKCKELCKED